MESGVEKEEGRELMKEETMGRKGKRPVAEVEGGE